MRKTDKNVIKICYRKRKSASASGGLRPPDPLPGLRPWTPLGDFRPPDPLDHLCSSKISFKKSPEEICSSNDLDLLVKLCSYCDVKMLIG